MSQTCPYCYKVVERACQSATEVEACKQLRRGEPAPQLERHVLLRAIQDAHRTHFRIFQGANFYDCGSCRLHVMFRGQALTWIPPRARKEREIKTLADVQLTVRR